MVIANVSGHLEKSFHQGERKEELVQGLGVNLGPRFLAIVWKGCRGPLVLGPHREVCVWRLGSRQLQGDGLEQP